jgi:hypothetical protein
MKKVFAVLILSMAVVTSCDKNLDVKTPSFKANSSLSKIWGPIKKIVEKMDYSIVYSQGGGAMVNPNKLSSRLLCLKDTIWTKFELRIGIMELDTTFSTTDEDLATKAILSKKRCGREEAEKILTSLVDFGLFDLEEEDKLLEKCKNVKSKFDVENDMDVGSDIFYIIKGNQVRKLEYLAPSLRKSGCQGMSEWENILKIVNLFDASWLK